MCAIDITVATLQSSTTATATASETSTAMSLIMSSLSIAPARAVPTVSRAGGASARKVSVPGPKSISAPVLGRPETSRGSVALNAKRKNRPTMLERYGSDDEDVPGAKGKAADDAPSDGKQWIELCATADFKAKPTKPVVLANGEALVVYKAGQDYYCSAANSTAYKFPMSDAKVIVTPEGARVEVPLDGTIYDLETGAVVTWCPKNNPLRTVLGAIKTASDPEPLQMYRTKIQKDKIMALV